MAAGHPAALSAGQARTVVLFPPDAFSFWLNEKGELVELVHIGIQRKEAVEHFAEQVNIALTGKAVAVEGHFNIQPRSR
jgi:hypothetical protein